MLWASRFSLERCALSSRRQCEGIKFSAQCLTCYVNYSFVIGIRPIKSNEIRHDNPFACKPCSHGMDVDMANGSAWNAKKHFKISLPGTPLTIHRHIAWAVYTFQRTQNQPQATPVHLFVCKIRCALCKSALEPSELFRPSLAGGCCEPSSSS